MNLPARVFTCSAVCQASHVACFGCGVLEGPDHFHRLQNGFCFALLSDDGTLVPIAGSCWKVRPRRAPLELVARVAAEDDEAAWARSA